jgi:outer membrane protein assembly factor BamB
MEDSRRNGRAGGGCVLALALLGAGVLLGAQIALSMVGLDLGYLLGRMSGDAPALVRATAVPTAVTAIQGAAPGNRIVWRAPIALDSDTREPEMLLISRNYDRGGDSIVYLSPDEQAARWESAPLGDNGSSWLVAYDSELIYVADKARLLGLGRSDGALRWEAPLSDEISYSLCQGCLRAVDGVVVALSDDGVLQAFRGTSGAPLWSVRLREATRQLVVLGDMVGAPDVRPDVQDSSAGLYLFNIADGSPARAIEPACSQPESTWEDRPHYYDPIYQSADGDELYWLLDSARCVVRAGASGLSAGAPVFMPENFSVSSSNTILAADGALYLSDDDRIVAVSADAAREVLAIEDYSLRPLGVRGETLLVEATRRRGSSRMELWAIDLASGQRRWERVLAGTDNLNGPYDTADWAAALVGDTVALVEQRPDAQTLAYELLSLSDGTSRASATIPVDDPDTDLRGLLVSRATAYLVAEELYAIELSSGQTLFRWP